MPGSNAGTGQPINFMCSRCRLRYRAADGRYPVDWTGGFHNVELTGRQRATPQGRGGVRNSLVKREYNCGKCGHTGWSRHTDLEHKENYELNQ